MLVLSCGHSVEHIYESYPISIRDIDYDYCEHKLVPAVSHLEVCKECYDNYADADLILYTTEQEDAYLNGE